MSDLDSIRTATGSPSTDEVTNQSPPLEGYNVFDADRALGEAVIREGGAWGVDRIRALGALAGGEALRLGEAANRNPPILRAFDRDGRRIDEVDFHPSWHALLQTAVAHGLHAQPWRDPSPGAHVVRAAGYFVFSQAEQGHGCPVTMTFAAVPALRAQPELAAEWEPLLTSLDYDPRLAPHHAKRGALAGMAMTEKQGGSDVRANTTRARPSSARTGPGEEYVLVGHKWFCSAPMSDVFLTLAQTDHGLTCFLLPRVLADGRRNAFHIQRLKDKLGNRSNASSEIELNGALARMLGEDGRGVATIIEMVAHTRFDCALGSAALMRHAVAQAAHHATYRRAFGRRLVDQPLMRNVLADLAIESEAATATVMRLARAYDQLAAEPAARKFVRLATAVAKFWICKRAVGHVAEALECLGGNGYVEESILPRLYREAPVNSVWEGSGNVMALDVARALRRDPETAAAFLAELEPARGLDCRLDAWLASTRDLLGAEPDETSARTLVAHLALALQASLLARFGDPQVADAFLASRLNASHYGFGMLPAGIDPGPIVERARPLIDRGPP